MASKIVCNLILKNIHTREIIEKNLCDKNIAIEKAWQHLRKPGTNPGMVFEIEQEGKSIWFGDSWDIMQNFSTFGKDPNYSTAAFNVKRMLNSQ